MTTLKNDALAAGLPAASSGGASGARSVSTPFSPRARDPVSFRASHRENNHSPLNKLLAVILTVAAVFCGTQAYGATYYVATNGNDANSGTIALPWRTVAFAVATMNPGDTTYVRGGLYNEALIWFKKSGTQAAPIKLLNYSGEAPIIHFIDPSQIQRIFIQHANGELVPIGWITIQGFEIRNGYNGIKFHSLHDSTISRNWIHDNNLASGIYGNGTRVLIDRNILNHNAFQPIGGNPPGGHGIYMNGSDNVFTNNLFYDNLTFGLQQNGTYTYDPATHPGPEFIISQNWVVANNVFAYQNGAPGMVVWGSGCDNTRIENNIFYENNVTGSLTNGVSFTSISGTTGVQIRNNLFYATGSGGTAAFGSGATEGVEYTQSGNIVNTLNPQFVNGGNNALPVSPDFHLTSGSPAIDSGLTVTEVAFDFDGTVRPQGTAYDIGADEFAAAGVPAAPSSLTATTAPSPDNYRQINLSWSNVANETGYKIERKKGSSGTYAQIATTGANVVTYSDSTCGSGTTYYYRVRAYNGSGNSGYSAEANATTVEITTGRQGHWKLDSSSGTTATDSSGNSNTGTLTGGPTWVAGKIGNGLNFDGVDDRVNAGSGASLDNLAAMTLTAWIKADTLGEGGKGRIVDKTTTVNPDNGWLFFLDGTNQVSFSVDYTTANLKRSTAINAVSVGTWIHVVATWTGSATATNIKFYVNGVETSYGTGTDGTGSRVNDGTANLSIGTDSTTARTFDGVLDDVRAYNRVLSTTEITAIYRAGL